MELIVKNNCTAILSL